MDKQPLNTGEQKDMTEFFTDLITKLEEMSIEMVCKHDNPDCSAVSIKCSFNIQTTVEILNIGTCMSEQTV